MADLPAGTDRNTLVIVRPKETPEGTDPATVAEYTVGAAWLQAFPEDFDFVRFEGESAEQAAAREEAATAAAAAETKAPKTQTPPPARTDF
jgi:hypothetical protein